MAALFHGHDDIDWERIGVGALTALVLAPALPILAFYISLWARTEAWFAYSTIAMPALAVLGICLITRNTWLRLLGSALCLIPVGFLFFAYAVSYGCSLQSTLGLPMISCL